VDPIFDRLETLFKSILHGDQADKPAQPPHSSRPDDDFSAAMDELDAFLNDDKAAQERLRREQTAREEARRRASGQTGSHSAGPPAKLLAACHVLGIRPDQSLPEAKKAWKDLIKQHHPDKHAGNDEAFRKATNTCARINDAYRIVETWHEKGNLGDE